MRRTIIGTSTALLLAGVSAQALAADTIKIDRDRDGTAEMEGVIMAGIDHDRDAGTPQLYAVDTDNDGDAESWVMRDASAEAGAYYHTYTHYQMPAYDGERRAMVDMDNDGVAEADARVLADFDIDGEGEQPTHYAVDVDGDGYADRWVYYNADLQTEGSARGHQVASDYLEITEAEQVAADISAVSGANQLDDETGPNPLESTRSNPGEPSDLDTGADASYGDNTGVDDQ
ncbi:hypothetical protein [Minwuia thermotolerans]|uniref:EF-hand domain-containing protein n=1 Tax=Minwuia thermotolerans TaxID=2056226 RepID=A0A2M9G1T7_9PROT|nr:hypothetical protein [Minwuia thermotolerans]PJK29673.1 hypothetical protein CVT23_11555 [Minwuia thermotolerans]